MIFKHHIDILIIKRLLRKAKISLSLAYARLSYIFHLKFMSQPISPKVAVRWIRIMPELISVNTLWISRGFFFLLFKSVGNIFFQFIGKISAWAIKIPNSTETYFTYFGKRHKIQKFTWNINVVGWMEKCFTTRTWLPCCVSFFWGRRKG